MLQIILNDEQAALVRGALKPVAVRDRQGNLLAVIQPTWTEEDLAEAERVLESDEPGYTLEQVKQHLQSLKKQ